MSSHVVVADTSIQVRLPDIKVTWAGEYAQTTQGRHAAAVNRLPRESDHADVLARAADTVALIRNRQSRRAAMAAVATAASNLPGSRRTERSGPLPALSQSLNDRLQRMDSLHDHAERVAQWARRHGSEANGPMSLHAGNKMGNGIEHFGTWLHRARDIELTDRASLGDPEVMASSADTRVSDAAFWHIET